MICPVCNKNFEPTVPHKKYCSAECRIWAYSNKLIPPREPYEFDCAHCGKHIVTAPYHDRRSRFCSRACEKKYWRHKKKHDGNLGMSAGMSLGTLIRRERRDLD